MLPFANLPRVGPKTLANLQPTDGENFSCRLKSPFFGLRPEVGLSRPLLNWRWRGQSPIPGAVGVYTHKIKRGGESAYEVYTLLFPVNPNPAVRFFAHAVGREVKLGCQKVLLAADGGTLRA